MIDKKDFSSGDRHYWEEQLGGELPVLSLPTDRPRTVAQTYWKAIHTFGLTEDLTHRLNVLAESAEEKSLFATLLAAFKILLYRLSGQEDILVVSPSGQHLQPREGAINYLMNPVILRDRIYDNQSFAELVKSVKQTVKGAIAHQNYPYERILEKLQPARETSDPNLFQVMFVWEQPEIETTDKQGPAEVDYSIGIEGRFLESFSREPFDVTLIMFEESGKLAASIEYNQALFDESTIVRMAGHFQTLLQGIVTNPQERVALLPLLTERDRHQLLVEWNKTQTEYPQNKCIHQLFEEQVERTPDAVAVLFENEQITYRELNAKANQLAHYLQAVGIGPEFLVGICIERSLKMVVGLLGILKAGGAYVPLDPAYPGDRLVYMLEDSSVSILLTQQHLVERLPSSSAKIVCLDSDWEIISQKSESNPFSAVRGENLAYVIYTSGSTGKPKGVAMQHRALTNLILWQLENTKVSGEAKTLQFSPVSFDVSFQEIFSTWCAGGTLVLISEEVRREPLTLLRLLAEKQVERLFLPFVALQQLAEIAESAGFVPTNLREVITAGEQLRITPSIAKLFETSTDCTLHNHYGPSESHVVTALTLTSLVSTWPALPSIGRPIANTQIYILDSHLQPVAIGMSGELYIGGDCLARGYLNRPDLTEQKFIPNPFTQKEESRLYKTGDSARYLSDGNIEYLGRIDNQVKIRGFRIELGEIEAVLSQHSTVKETVVMAREDTPGDKCLVAYTVPKTEQVLSVSELREFLKEKLPDYMMPSFFVLLDGFPLTPSGKIDRRALPAPNASQRSLEVDFVAPRTTTEEVLTDIWSEVLGVKVGICDNFMELGGHSLLATKIIARMRDRLQIELPFSHLFQSPTVAELSKIVEGIIGTQERGITTAPKRQARERSPIIPLSFSQEQLWFLSQLAADSPVYNEALTIHLAGNINIIALEQSLTELIRRHEILRTTFPVVDSNPIQQIHPPSAFKLPIEDLRHLDETPREIEAMRIAKQQLRQPFDLTSGPLLRVILILMADADYRLYLAVHHILVDGTSLYGIFLRELETLYAAFCEAKPSPLPQLTIQYADFTAWQRQRSLSEIFSIQLAYWQKKLADLPQLQLPTDRLHAPQTNFSGSQLGFSMSKELTEKLNNFSSSEGVTLFVTLAAAIKVLLNRYSAQEDIAIGTVISTRDRLEAEGVMGSFLNTLVLRTDLSGNPSFRELLKRERHVTLEAYSHKDLPFDKLVAALHIDRLTNQNPLFQVAFILQPPLSESKLGWRASEFEVDSETSKLDLTFNMQERSQGIIGEIEYRKDLFDRATIERAIGHLITLLEGIVANPDRRISELPLLTDREQYQLLGEWNNTQTEYPKDRCIHQVFEDRVERTPDAIAVVFEDQQLTYRELNQRANQLAHYLQANGVKPDVLVGICVERSIEMIVGLLGIIKAGGAYVPLDPNYPAERLAFVLEDTAVPVLVSQQQFLEKLGDRQAHIVCYTDWDAIASFPSSNPSHIATPDNLAYISYTSGSTGKPKGVSVIHRGVVRLVQSTNYVNLSTKEVFLQFAPLAFDASTFEIWGSLLNGARLIIMPPHTLSLKELGSAIQRYQVTILWLTAGLFHLMVDERIEDLKPVRQLLAGGDVLSVPHVRKFLSELPECQLINGYGPTENTTFTCCYSIADINQVKGSVAIGRPIANTRVYILDRYLQPVPIGVPGELYIEGDGLARGYLNRPELTVEKFIPNPFNNFRLLNEPANHSTSPIHNIPSSRLYKTGDLVRYLPDGNIEFLGRLDNQVKIRGFRIELGEIEAVIASHPDVKENAVTVREDSPGNNSIVAYIVLKSQDSSMTFSEFRSFLKEKLPDYMLPNALVILEALPLTPNGKIDRRALPAPVRDCSDIEADFAAPSDALEIQLKGIWQEVLGIKTIGVKENFFELGGHSLLAVRLFVQIENVFGKNLPLATLFAAPTIEQFADILRKKGWSSPWNSLVIIQKGGNKKPLFCMHAVGGNVLSYQNLALYLGKERPVYGLQARGLDGKTEPHSNIEEMAADYIKEMRIVQPNGPYFLAGHSSGGVVAFEIAQQLVAVGEKVALLALFDAYSPSLFGDREPPISYQLYIHWFNLKRLKLKEKLNYIFERAFWNIERLLQKMTDKLYQAQGRPLLNELPEYLQHIEEANLQMMKKYVPQMYPGKLTIFRAQERPTLEYYEPALGWQDLAAGGVEIVEVPGHHKTMILEPRVRFLAEKLTGYLEIS